MPIQDPARLAKIARRLVAPFGSQRKASSALGISQTQLSRMANQDLGELSSENVRRLFEITPPNDKKALCRVFVMRSPAALRRAYREWVNEQREVASFGATRRWFRTTYGLRDEERPRQAVGKSDRDRERQALWEYVEELAPQIVRAANMAFRKVRDRGYIELALIRILDPLINGPDTGFVEPSWREWRNDEKGRQRLLKFVRLGLEREMLLLRGRLQTSERAIAVLSMAYDDFVRIHGGSAESIGEHPNPFDLIGNAYLHGANSTPVATE